MFDAGSARNPTVFVLLAHLQTKCVRYYMVFDRALGVMKRVLAADGHAFDANNAKRGWWLEFSTLVGSPRPGGDGARASCRWLRLRCQQCQGWVLLWCRWLGRLGERVHMTRLLGVRFLHSGSLPCCHAILSVRNPPLQCLWTASSSSGRRRRRARRSRCGPRWAPIAGW